MLQNMVKKGGPPMTGSSTLAVCLHNKRIGILRRVRNGARFSYTADVASRMQGTPLLSTFFPVCESEYDAATTAIWFQGLLPEDARLDQVRRFYDIEGGDYIDVLECIGWECAGAVSVMSEAEWQDRRKSEKGQEVDYQLVTATSLAERLAALPSYPYDTQETLRMSLGGFQEKLCVYGPPFAEGASYVSSDGFAIPVGGAPSTHIVKPQPLRFPGLVQAEAWAMHVASCVTDTTQVAVLELPDGAQALCVERFDRMRGEGGEIARIHQEDCAQALGISPEHKYAAHTSPKKSDPSFARIAKTLLRYAEDDGEDQLMRLFDQMVVNVALGNTDAHAKNYSLMHVSPLGIRLSPLYDVVPALEITPGIKHMGMRVANQIAISKVGREELISEGTSWGLSGSALEERLDSDLKALASGLERARADYPQAASRHEGPALERLARLQ